MVQGFLRSLSLARFTSVTEAPERAGKGHYLLCQSLYPQHAWWNEMAVIMHGSSSTRSHLQECFSVTRRIPMAPLVTKIPGQRLEFFQGADNGTKPLGRC